jgi:uncharacterized protein
MNQKLINQIEDLVKEACCKKTNIFGENIWNHHIIPVVDHSIQLAKILNIDLECAILSAYLHDYASVLDKDLYPEHHIHGANIAEQILLGANYPIEKIAIIKDCIMNHRGSIKNNMTSPEIKCLASADAMAHITEVPSLLYLAYHERDMSVEEGKKWVLNKINRGWSKICLEAKNLIDIQYDAARILLK